MAGCSWPASHNPSPLRAAGSPDAKGQGGGHRGGCTRPSRRQRTCVQYAARRLPPRLACVRRLLFPTLMSPLHLHQQVEACRDAHPRAAAHDRPQYHAAACMERTSAVAGGSGELPLQRPATGLKPNAHSACPHVGSGWRHAMCTARQQPDPAAASMGRGGGACASAGAPQPMLWLANMGRPSFLASMARQVLLLPPAQGVV